MPVAKDADIILYYAPRSRAFRMLWFLEELGRPYLYSTTKRFLQVFGLVNLEELPRGEELRASPLPPMPLSLPPSPPEPEPTTQHEHCHDLEPEVIDH